MMAVASATCSDNVALAKTASLDCALASFSSIVRRTLPQRSRSQLAVASTAPWVITLCPEPAPTEPVPVVPVTPPPLRERVTEPVTPTVGKSAASASFTSASAC